MGWFSNESNKSNRKTTIRAATPVRVTATSLVRKCVVNGCITGDDYEALAQLSSAPDYSAANQILLDAINDGSVEIM